MSKRDFINFVFVLSYPYYGLFCYYGKFLGPTVGTIASALPYWVIVFFYLIDILYKRDFRIKVRGDVYWLTMAYIFSIIVSFFVANFKGTPLISTPTAIAGSLNLLVIFPAFLVVFLYNGEKGGEVIPRLIFISITVLLLLNVLGFYGLGISARTLDYEGDRDDLPFFRGAYEAGTMAAVMFLLVIWLIGKSWGKPLRVLGLVLFVLFLSFILIRVNSRISVLLLMLTLGLYAARVAKSQWVYWLSFLTLPLVLNSRYLLFEIMSLPILKPLMVRTDFEEVVTLNGRTLVWERGIEWLLYDQRGLLFGLGHQGQQFISLLRDIQLLWHPYDPHVMHFHSTTFEVLVNQGLIGLILLLVLLYKLFVFYRKEFESNRTMGMFFIVVVFLLFGAQIDTFIMFESTGTIFLWFLLAGAAVKIDYQDKSKVIANLSDAEATPVKSGRYD